jgi:uncharacterized damage-inducible protein DinB
MGVQGSEGSNSAESRGTVKGCETLAVAAGHLLAQCEAFVLSLPDAAFTAESVTLQGGTVGKHLRHTLDHFAAALGWATGGEVTSQDAIDYDRRERNVPMETDRHAAVAGIAQLRDRLAEVSLQALDAPVRVRVMVTSDGQEAELRSTLGRELAFATHHAVHHQAMMQAIAREFGLETAGGFGKAPSTLKHERGR